MPKKTLTGLVLLVLAAAVVVASASPDEPPKIVIPETSLLTGLSPQERSTVEAYIKYYAGPLRDAETPQAVVQARRALIDGYNLYPSAVYQDFYASTAVAVLSPLLRKPPAKLRNVKEINTAMVFGELRRLAAQSGYEVLVASKNDGVRYLGWRAYRQMSTEILAEGGEPAGTFYASLRKAAASERSPIVTEELFRTLTPPEFFLRPIEAEALKKARRELFSILQVAWLRWCVQVRRGNAGAVRSLNVGLGAILTSRRVLEQDDATKRQVCQSLLDMVWAAAKAYAEDKGSGEVAEAFTPWLIDLEGALNVAAGAAQKPVANALRAKDVAAADKAFMVDLGAHEWVDRLKPIGVKDPAERVKPKPTTTAPAATTRPAP
jgi:hypothetical protein